MKSWSSQDVMELLRACAESNEVGAWEEFIKRYHRPISLSVIRTAQRWGGLAQEIALDLVQDTYLKLCDGKCNLLYNFALSHPEAVEGYIKTIAANVTHDYFKSKQAVKHGSGSVLQVKDELDPQALDGSLGGVAAIEREILLREIESCLDFCTEGTSQERDRLVFWLYYQQGLSARAIADLPNVGLTVKGVESLILRLTRMVRDRIQSRQGVPFNDSATDAEGFRPAKSY